VSQAVNPVSQAKAYQQLMLDLAGDGDPADPQGRTAAEIREVLAEAGSRLRQRPAEGEWSVLELLGHLVDAELVLGARYRWVLAEDHPEIVAYDQDHWVAALKHNEGDPEALLREFEALRASNLALWRRSSDEQKARWGMHSERGEESFDIMFRMSTGHSRFHLNQMRDTIAALKQLGR
jgi:hypothetical protein